MTRRTISLHALAFSLTALSAAACPAPTAEQCSVGTEGCACTPGGGCDPGLTCASNTCVDLGGGSEDPQADDSGSASASTSEASNGTDASTSMGDSDGGLADSSSGSVDECAENGGTLLSGGFCYKQCTFDEDAAGHDLLDDCSVLGMICRNESSWGGQDFCFPANSTCSADADCETGLKCVHIDSEIAGSDNYCQVPCDPGGACPEAMRCVTSCEDGYFIDLDFCAGPFGWPAENPEPSVCCPGSVC